MMSDLSGVTKIILAQMVTRLETENAELKKKVRTEQAGADRMREALKTVANYFGVFGVKIGEKGPSFGEAGRACAEALGYSGDSYSNSKWGEPTEPAAPEKAETCECWIGIGIFADGMCGVSTAEGAKEAKDFSRFNYCPWCGKPIAEGEEI